MGSLVAALAVVQLTLVAFAVSFPWGDPLRNLALGLALFALGLGLPRGLSLPSAPSDG